MVVFAQRKGKIERNWDSIIRHVITIRVDSSTSFTLEFVMRRVPDHLGAFDAVYEEWSSWHGNPTAERLVDEMYRIRARHSDLTTVDGSCDLLTNIRFYGIQVLIDLKVNYLKDPVKAFNRVSAHWSHNPKVAAAVVWMCLQQVTDPSLESYEACLMELCQFTIDYQVDLETQLRAPVPSADSPPDRSETEVQT